VTLNEVTEVILYLAKRYFEGKHYAFSGPGLQGIEISAATNPNVLYAMTLALENS